MYLYEIIPLSISISKKQTLSYYASEKYNIGDLVYIPLQKKIQKGIILKRNSLEEKKQEIKSLPFSLKKIHSLIGPSKIFSKDFFSLIPELSTFYRISPIELVFFLKPEKEILEERLKERENEFFPHSSFSQKEIIAPISRRERKILEIIEMNKKKGASTHIIFPNERKIKKIKELLTKNYQNIATLSSKTGKKERTSIFSSFEKKDTLILLSTAKFIDTPLFRKKTLIIEEASSSTYKSVTKPHIDMRYLAKAYAKKAKLELFFLSSSLHHSFFQWKGAKKIEKQYSNLLFFPFKEKKDLPRLKEIERKKRKNTFLFNQNIEEDIKKQVKEGKKIFIYSQKKHYASRIVCADCGNVLKNPENGNPLIFSKRNGKIAFYDKKKKEFIQHSDFCPVCGSWKLIPIGIGSECIFDFIKKILPKKNVILVDEKQIEENKKLLKEVKENLKKRNFDILIGTRKAISLIEETKIHFEKIYIPSLDTSFFLSNPYQEELILETIDMLSSFSKKIVLQTRLFSGKKEKIKTNLPTFQKFLEKIQRKTSLKTPFTEYLPLWNFLEGKEKYKNIIQKQEKILKKRIFLLQFKRKKRFLQYQKEIEETALKEKIAFLPSRNEMLIFLEKEEWKIIGTKKFTKFIPFHSEEINVILL